MSLTLGGYELGGVVGRGAMGEVRSATRIGSEDVIAVKILRPELVDDPVIVTRFLQERDVLCGLNHPNLVKVHDLIVEGGSAAIVMDFVDGPDLRFELNRCHTLRPERAARITAQLLNALTAVHAIDVVHRDVKPENILLSSDDQVHLTDFGIARLANGPALTRMTGLIGTPEYLAPELAEGEQATPAADVYSAGVVLYELLTGSTPFAGGHPVAVLRRHLEESPSRPEGLPDPLWSLLDAMLDKRPDRRPETTAAASVLLELAPSLEHLQSLPPSRPNRQSEELTTSLKVRLGDKTESATVLKGSKGAVATPSAKWEKKRVLLVAAVLVLIVAAAAITLGVATNSVTAKPVTYKFPDESFSSGLIVNRTWSLSGPSDTRLSSSTTVSNGASKPINNQYEEVIPKSVARNVDKMRFSPLPEKVIKSDPVVGYDVALASGSSTKVGYRVTIPSFTVSPSAELLALARDQERAQAAFLKASGQAVPITLISISISPPSVSLPVGGTQTFTLTGMMSDGKAATSAELAPVTWASSQSAVASVVGGVVGALQKGVAIITAQVEHRSATATVTVMGIGSTSNLPEANPSNSGSGRSAKSQNSATSNSNATPTTGSAPTSPVATTAPSPTRVPVTSAATTTTTSTTSTTIPPVDAMGCPLVECVRSPDINGDGVVNCADLAILSSEYGETGPDLSADINGDRVVNGGDLALLSHYWTPGQTTSCP